ncbi:MAG: DUF1707 domain-containing protein [Actinobacteria bacterium]|nr:DUF1707 domain-containing protein [Actinomycetota bacterium]
MSVESASERPSEPEPQQTSSPIRVGDRDRDAVVQRLQQAFAEGRLDDDEFDQRTRAALTARLSGELAVLTQDLPETADAPRPAPTAGGKAGQRAGGSAVAYKSSVRRAGRWRVPEHFRTIVYKGSGHIDLRAAELTAHETTLAVIAYKSRVDVLVPLGVRMNLEGFGVTKGWSAAEDLEDRLPADAPVVHVRGIAYKGTIEVSTKPPDPAQADRRELR